MINLLPRILTLALILLLVGCGNAPQTENVPVSESSETTEENYLSAEEESQLKFCKLVVEAYASYETNGMSYETRDVFGKAYDVVHEELLPVYGGSRYFDYDGIMADHSFAYVSPKMEQVKEIISWCEKLNLSE